ncbi:MAG: DUF1801 domain-containing protein [Bacteroidota bacterium]
MAKQQLSNTEKVNAYLSELNHPLKDVVIALRKEIGSVKQIEEHIKWNSLSFYYSGEIKNFNAKEYSSDLVVLNLSKKEYVLLVFPTGAKITVTNNLLEGNYTDGRKMAKILNIADLKNKKIELHLVINDWLSKIE